LKTELGRSGNGKLKANLTGPDEGIECKAGQFIWRPAGSRHSAWSPNGGLFLAMFQIPNKFFSNDGQVTDMAGTDWASIWGDS